MRPLVNLNSIIIWQRCYTKLIYTQRINLFATLYISLIGDTVKQLIIVIMLFLPITVDKQINSLSYGRFDLNRGFSF